MFCVIRTISAKTALLICPGGGVLRLFRTRFFALGAVVLQPILRGGGDSAFSKRYPGSRPGGSGC